jgi:hypothetical protein
MNSLMTDMKGENGKLRGLTGSGEPGLFTLLGGTSPEMDSSGYTFGGGPGQVSATAKVARAHKDVRIAALSSGQSVPGTGAPGGGGGRGPGGDTRPGYQQK